MKIGIDCRLWNETGVGRYIRNLVLNLQKLDNKNDYILFVLSKDREGILKQVQNDKFKIIEANIRWHTLEEQLKFPKILNKENLDLVHFPYQSVPFFYNRPFVITIHDLIPYHYPTSKASALPFPLYYLKLLGYKFVMNQAARKAKKIITVSQATRDEVIDHLGVDRDKVVVTYEGVEEKVQSSKLKVKSLVKGTYFLYVGNAYPHKNLDRLLEAFTMLITTNKEQINTNIGSKFDKIRDNSHINLILVGKKDYFYKRLKKKVEEMKVSEKVIFLENVTDEELSNLYKNALALIMPSFMEGFGLPALEAMANRCLVLASDIPTLRETCGNAALYFDPLSIDELLEKLRMVSFHTAEYGRLEELRKKGIERAKLFSWQKMAKETLAVYEDAAATP